MAKVLVADYSLSVRTVVERALKSKQIDVVSASSGMEAMAQIRREEPDLVLCDIVMPDMEGYEICEFVRDHPRLAHTPVLLMAGVVNGAVLARAAEARSNDVIRKPFAAEDLLGRIDELLAVTAGRAEAFSGSGAPSLHSMSAIPALGHDLSHGGPELGVDDLNRVLSRLAAVPGVTLAAVVDCEGFLIESAGDDALDAEVVGAVAACLAESSERLGGELRQGALLSMVLEYDAGLILVNALGPTAKLATILGDPAVLGKVRYYVNKTIPDLLRAL